MGAICAPSNSNFFIEKFESIHIYPYIREKTMTYLRYADDLFFIWTTTKNTPSLSSILNTEKDRKSLWTLRSTKTLMVNFV